MFSSISQLILVGVASVMGLVLIGALMGRLRAAMLVIGGMLLLSSLGVALDYFGNEQRLWLYPIQAKRSPLFMALGVTLYVTVVAHLRYMNLRRVSGPGIVLLMIALYAAMLQAVHESPMESLKSIAFVCATLVPLLLVIPAVLAERVDWFRLLRTVMFVHGVWVGGVLVQIGVNHHAMVLGRGLRFVGLTPNPLHASVLLAIMAVVALWLALNDLRRFRMIWAVAFGMTILLLGWTGSRTGIGMLTIGASAVLYTRVGRSILILPVVAVGAAVAYKVLQTLDIDLGLSRLMSTVNTREQAWSTLLRSGLSNPIVGVGIKRAGDTESSYLLAFAAYGVGMVGLVWMLVVASGVQWLRLLRRRSRLSSADRTLIDLIIGVQVMYFAGAVFEGYIMARVSAPLTFLLIFAGMGTALIKSVEEGVWAVQPAQEDQTDDREPAADVAGGAAWE